jgi:hypothetical protein
LESQAKQIEIGNSNALNTQIENAWKGIGNMCRWEELAMIKKSKSTNP